MVLMPNEKKMWKKKKRIADKNGLFAEINDVGNVHFGKGLHVGVTSNTSVSAISVIRARAKLMRNFPDRVNWYT